MGLLDDAEAIIRRNAARESADAADRAALWQPEWLPELVEVLTTISPPVPFFLRERESSRRTIGLTHRHTTTFGPSGTSGWPLHSRESEGEKWDFKAVTTASIYRNAIFTLAGTKITAGRGPVHQVKNAGLPRRGSWVVSAPASRLDARDDEGFRLALTNMVANLKCGKFATDANGGLYVFERLQTW